MLPQKLNSFIFKKHANRYEISNCYLQLDPLIAYSYNWWEFVKVINGKLIFNNFTYSATTTAHQYKTRRLLRQLGLVIDVEIEAPSGLQSMANTVLHYGRLIASLERDIAKPRSNKRKNTERKLLIARHTITLDFIMKELI